MFRNISGRVVLLMAVCCCLTAQAQPDFFWSFSNLDLDAVNSDLESNLFAFNVVGGTGIRASQGPESIGILDAGYDPSSEAFLFGSVDFNVVGAGQTEFIINPFFPSQCPPWCIDPSFGGVTISVAVPEPTVLPVIYCVAFIGSSFNRRSRRDRTSVSLVAGMSGIKG